MLQHSFLVDWCKLTARPVLEAAAFGQPVSFSAKQAIRRLDVLLSGDMSAADRGRVSMPRNGAVFAGPSTSIPRHTEALSSH